MLKTDDIIIDAKSGASGAGRAAKVCLQLLLNIEGINVIGCCYAQLLFFTSNTVASHAETMAGWMLVADRWALSSQKSPRGFTLTAWQATGTCQRLSRVCLTRLAVT
jgi:hypothetical protein